MPIELKDFPRPPGDNGRGLAASPRAGAPTALALAGGAEGYDYWIGELAAMGIKWLRLIDSGGDSLPLCEKLLAAGIFPIVRILRKDPPPNDLPEPNPGHLGNTEEETIKRLIAAGVRYFETNNEPDLRSEWKNGAMPTDAVETAKLVALSWLFDARLILELGGLPGLPAISNGGDMDLVAALVSIGRQDILLQGAWISVHNYSQNHPLAYPDDPVNRTGQPLTPAQYDAGPYTAWVWWNANHRRVDTIEQVNNERAAYKNPSQTILHDHACFREFEYYNHLAVKYLGRSIPILSTESGYRVGRREDPRYPRITPEAHRDQTVALYDFMQRQAPDYYLAAAPSVLWQASGNEMDAWYSAFWQNTLKNGSNGRGGIPRTSVPEAVVGERLPVIDAVKAMPSLARRLPGAQPPPPVQPTVTGTPPTRKTTPPPPPPPLATVLADEPAQSMASPAVEPVRASAWPETTTKPAEEQEKESTMIHTNTPPPPESVVPPAPAKPEFSEPAPTWSFKTASPSLLFSSLPVPILDWDPRLDALNVRLEHPEVMSGAMYWKLIRAEYQGPEEADGKHNIMYTVQDEQGKPVEFQRVWQGWAEDKTDATTNDKGEATITLWSSFAPDRAECGPYTAWVDGLPSERITGLGLPHKRQVNFLLTWRRVLK